LIAGRLYDALASGRLAGAALDVWYRYPTSSGSTAPGTSPFHELRNVIVTPHVSGWTGGHARGPRQRDRREHRADGARRGAAQRHLRIDHPMEQASKHWSAQLPFYFGWLIVAIAFVTMAIGVTGRTSFSLLLPPLIDEFKWDRGLAAGAFSFGFLFSAVVSPFVGRVVDARGPRIVIWTGVALMSAGLLLAP
jgi:hypothetical protein